MATALPLSGGIWLLTGSAQTCRGPLGSGFIALAGRLGGILGDQLLDT